MPAPRARSRGVAYASVQNFRKWPRSTLLTSRSTPAGSTHRYDLVVVENLISYNGAPWMCTVNLLKFRGSQAATE